MADEKFAENPWSAEFWNLTKQGEYVKKYGVERAKLKAKRAGARLGDLKPFVFAGQYAPIPKSNFTVVVQRRNVTTINNGGGGGDEGPVLPTALATDPK